VHGAERCLQQQRGRGHDQCPAHGLEHGRSRNPRTREPQQEPQHPEVTQQDEKDRQDKSGPRFRSAERPDQRSCRKRIQNRKKCERDAIAADERRVWLGEARPGRPAANCHKSEEGYGESTDGVEGLCVAFIERLPTLKTHIAPRRAESTGTSCPVGRGVRPPPKGGLCRRQEATPFAGAVSFAKSQLARGAAARTPAASRCAGQPPL